jgi:segregation and condensation protein B
MEDAVDKQEDPQDREESDSSAVAAADELAGQAEAACHDDANAGGGAGDPADGPDDSAGSGLADAAAGAADGAAEREVAATVEAILFAADSPLSAAKIALLAELPNRGVVKKAVARLNERYDEIGCSFRIEPIAGGYQMLTRPEYHDVVARLFKNRSDSKLSQAAMETLAIVAYRQPILRADIEAVRGVASGEMLRSLLDKNLVKIVGRAEVLGRPMLYGTTRQFLEVFGLNGIDDLPNVESLRAGRDANANAKKPAAVPAEPGDGTPAEEPAPADAEAQAPPPPPPADEHAQEPQEPPASANEDSDPPPEAL